MLQNLGHNSSKLGRNPEVKTRNTNPCWESWFDLRNLAILSASVWVLGFTVVASVQRRKCQCGIKLVINSLGSLRISPLCYLRKLYLKISWLLAANGRKTTTSYLSFFLSVRFSSHLSFFFLFFLLLAGTLWSYPRESIYMCVWLLLILKLYLVDGEDKPNFA